MAITLTQSGTTQVMLFSSGGVWSATTSSLTGVADSALLVSAGGWWDAQNNTGGTTPVPTDSNGTFSKCGTASPTNPTGPTPAPGWPVNTQLCEQLAAASGSHTFTPPVLANGGDGYFKVMEFGGGSAGTWTRVDQGYGIARSGTAGAVDGVTVTTDGTNALIGDLVVAVAVTDGDPTAIGIAGPTSGGYTDVLTSSTSADNVSVGIGYKIATADGAQSAVWAWADSACEIGTASIAVFRFTPNGPTINTQPVNQTGSVGGTATFTVAATSSGGSLSYQWKLNGSNVGTNSSSYTTGTLAAADNGSGVTCDVTDSNGTVTTRTALLFIRDIVTGKGRGLMNGWTYDREATGRTLIYSLVRKKLGPNIDIDQIGKTVWLDWFLGIASSGSDVTVSITGSTATFSQGSLSTSSAVSLSGSSATFSPGTVVPGSSVPVTGSSATFSSGSVTPEIRITLAGQSATFSPGTLTPATAVSASGSSASFSAGSVTPEIRVTASSQTATFSPGAVSPATAVSLSGATATFTPGSVLVGGDVTVTITGTTATFSIGSVTPETAVSGSSQTASFSQGTATPATDVSASGQSATFSQGSVSVGSDVTVSITGSTATFSSGTITPSSSVEVTGSSATFTGGSGSVTLSVPLTGQSASFSTGAVSPSTSVSPSGQTATFSQGNVTTGGDVTVTLTGLTATFNQGSVSVSGGSGSGARTWIGLGVIKGSGTQGLVS